MKRFQLPRPVVFRLMLVLTALLSVSCTGPSFHRAWRAAKSSPQADPVCGRWQGEWRSEANGHHGKLQCVVTPPAQPGEPHEFYYRATWQRILSGPYRAKHQVKPAGPDKWTLSGEQTLPAWAGGRYEYRGTLTPDTFSATYQCAIDRGTYQLRRVD